MSEDTKNQDPRLLDALGMAFVGEAMSPEDAFSVVESNDDAVRALFNRLALADRELTHDEPSPFERNVRDAQILGAIDSMLEDEKAPVIELASRRPSHVAVVGALIAAAAAVLLVVSPSVNYMVDDGFQARSSAPTTSIYGRPEVAVFCVRDGNDGPDFKSEHDFDFDIVQCAIDDDLKLAYRNVDPRLKYVSFVGVSEQGTLLWYGPTPAAPDSLVVQHQNEWTSAGETLRLAVNHKPGAVKVHGIFSEQPMPFEGLNTMMATHPRSFESTLEAPANAVTTSIIFEISASREESR